MAEETSAVTSPDDRTTALTNTAATIGDRVSSMLRSTLSAACIEVRTKKELDARPEARATALDRHHRSLMVDARTLEEAIVRKRGELEESLIRIDELQAAIHQRETVLANPRPPSLQMAQREAAHALYDSLAAGGADDFGLEVTPAADPAGLRLIEWADSQSLDYSDDEDPLSRSGSFHPQQQSEMVDGPLSEAGKALDFLRSLLPVAPPGSTAAADTRSLSRASRHSRAAADSRQPSAVPSSSRRRRTSKESNEHAKSGGGLAAGGLGGSLLAGSAPAKPADRYSLEEEERRAQLNQVRGADTRTMSAVVPPNRSLSKGQAAPQRRNRRYSAENNIDASSLAPLMPTAAATAATSAPPPPPPPEAVAGTSSFEDQRSMSAVVELPGMARNPFEIERSSDARRSRTANEANGAAPAAAQPLQPPQPPQPSSALGLLAQPSANPADMRTMSAVVAPNRPLSTGEAAPRGKPRRYSAENNVDAASLAPLMPAAAPQVGLTASAPPMPVARPAGGVTVPAGAGDDESYYSDSYSYSDSQASPLQSTKQAAAVARAVAAATAAAATATASAVPQGISPGSAEMELSMSEYYSDEEPAVSGARRSASQQQQPAAAAAAAVASSAAEPTPPAASAARWLQEEEDEALGGDGAVVDEFTYSLSKNSSTTDGGKPSSSAAAGPAPPAMPAPRRSPFAAGAAVKMAESGDSISRDVTQYLALRPSEDEFREMQREEAAKRMAAMEAGSVLVKFNAGKGMFSFKSEASRMVERWVVLNTKMGGPNAELSWGDPKTKKPTTVIKLSECKRVLYGHASETLRAFDFNPHAAWLCFSVETNQGRTFDFAASTEAIAHTWVVGLSTLIGTEIDHGWLLWKTLELKMKEDLSQAGLPGMVKRVAQRLQLEGETGELNVAREAEKATIMRELARENAAREAAAVMTRGVTTSPPPQQQQPPPPQPAKSAPLPAQPPPQQQPPQPAISDPSLPRMPHPPRPPDGGKDDEEYSEYSEYSEYDGKQLAYEERLLDYEEALLERDEKAGVTGA